MQKEAVDRLIFRNMTLDELKVIIQRQNDEGWDLCANEAEAIYAQDPKGFFAAELDGFLVGSLAIISYAEDYKYGTIYTVHKDYRGKGLGPPLFEYGAKQANFEQPEDAAVGESEYHILPIYEKRGWQIFCNEYEFIKTAETYPEVEGIVDLKTIPIENLYAYDKKVFGYARETYLKILLNHEEHFGVAKLDRNGDMTGYAILKKITDESYKICPWSADSKEIALEVLQGAQRLIPGKKLFVVILDVNKDAMELVEKSEEWKKNYSLYRIYKSHLPKTDWNRSFGIGGEFH